MIALVLRAYFKNQLTLFDMEKKSHISKLTEIFSSEEIEAVIGGKIIRNLIRMDKLNSIEFRQVEDCLNNNAKNILKEIGEINLGLGYTTYNFKNGLIVRIKI